jgi:hypothetical protein
LRRAFWCRFRFGAGRGLFSNPSCGRVQSSPEAHRDICNDYIWPESDVFLQHGSAIGYDRNDGICLFEVGAQHLGEYRVVISNEDAGKESARARA